MVAQNLDFSQLNVGDQLPPLEFGAISRHILALYCGGSGDHNPIHVDIDFAKAAGYDDVFAHGMLSMAILGRLLTCLLYTSPSPRDQRGSRMPSSA